MSDATPGPTFDWKRLTTDGLPPLGCPVFIMGAKKKRLAIAKLIAHSNCEYVWQLADSSGNTTEWLPDFWAHIPLDAFVGTDTAAAPQSPAVIGPKIAAKEGRPLLTI